MAQKVLLVLLDGWGYREEKDHNALALAHTPYFDYLWKTYPHSILQASGESLGLPAGQAGGSEVGHLAIGAGRPIPTDIVRINRAISNGEMSSNPAFLNVCDHVLKHNSNLHIFGLLGPAGIHAHKDHMIAVLETIKDQGIKKVYIHAFTDGRDTAPNASMSYLEELEEEIQRIGVGFVATVSGRYYAMDRDNNWDRLEKVEKAIFQGDAKHRTKEKPSKFLQQFYDIGLSDEHIEPIVFTNDQGESYQISPNDGIIHTNFRADRCRMISAKIIEKKSQENFCYVTMTEYDESFDCLVAFPPEKIDKCLARVISENQLSQFHTAETEKYAHATYFLNGGIEAPFPGEERVLIKSRTDIKIPDEAPELKAPEVTKATIKSLKEGKNFVFVNYANPDLVGHTANVKAITTAVETVDREIKKLCQTATREGYDIIITSDHGNIEINFDVATGQKHTGHTENPVPFILLDKKRSLKDFGSLIDVAPTVLELMSIQKPTEMTGSSLLVN